uniref:Uncharacterized protein n=1 Tax=Nucleocytoviricota sp. TaxID=2809609 RepID=A0A9E8GBC6_9VIRU|nr:hypothetical protein [Nucleocytoviricota sp.]UZT29240.1 hypothetical protein [Nucleocytoviricota sp.]
MSNFNRPFNFSIPKYPYFFYDMFQGLPNQNFYSTLPPDISLLIHDFSLGSDFSTNYAQQISDNSFIIALSGFNNDSYDFVDNPRFLVDLSSIHRLNSFSITIKTVNGAVAYSYYIDIHPDPSSIYYTTQGFPTNNVDNSNTIIFVQNLSGITTKFISNNSDNRNNPIYRFNQPDLRHPWDTDIRLPSGIEGTTDICANQILDAMYTIGNDNLPFSNFFTNNNAYKASSGFSAFPGLNGDDTNVQFYYDIIKRFFPNIENDSGSYFFYNKFYFNYNIANPIPANNLLRISQSDHESNITKIVQGSRPNPIPSQGVNDPSSISINGTLGSNSSDFNNICSIINGYNFDTFTYDPNNIFGIEGLPSFIEAITKVNNKNLTQNQLYNLYVTRNIRVLSDISFGPKFSDLSNAPLGRPSLDCSIRDTSNISDVINVNNFQWFTDLKYVANNYKHLLNTPGVASSGLTDSNKTILNRFLYNNLFPERSNKKKYAYLANKKIKHTTRIFPPQFVTKQETCNKLKMRFN